MRIPRRPAAGFAATRSSTWPPSPPWRPIRTGSEPAVQGDTAGPCNSASLALGRCDRTGGSAEGSLAEVLVADDGALARRFLVDAVQAGGHTVTSACDGIDAIVRITGPGRFDAVITDYTMPRANGIEVNNHAQRVDPTL